MTITEFSNAVREITFDRFVTPSFYIQKDEYKIHVTSDRLQIKDEIGAVVTDLDFITYPTMQSLFSALAGDSKQYALSYGASFLGSEPSNSLLMVSNNSINSIYSITRQFFFSDDFIRKELRHYGIFYRFWKCGGTDQEIDTWLDNIQCPQDYHATLWVSYHILEKRRLYELAAISLGQSTMSITGDGKLISSSPGGVSTTVSVGSVFNLSDDPNSLVQDGKDFNNVGADNVFGDWGSFWYRLQSWVRDRLEQLFADFSLRKDQAIPGRITLERDTNYYSYFDSYPFTLSAYTRGLYESSPDR